MNQFDPFISAIHREIEKLFAEGRQIRSLTISGTPGEIIDALPMNVGRGANRGIILRSDTYAELGGPETGSTSMMMFTSDPSLIENGRVTLFGHDIADQALWSPGYAQLAGSGNIHETDSDHDQMKQLSAARPHKISLPFGRVVMAGGRELTENDLGSLNNSLIIADQIEGYMERSQAHHIWVRISREVFNKGFTLLNLGKALMALIREANPKVETIGIAFVTTSKYHIDILEKYALQVHKIAKELTREHWKIKGYDLECSSECDLCDDKPVCDEIRKTIRENGQQV